MKLRILILLALAAASADAGWNGKLPIADNYGGMGYEWQAVLKDSEASDQLWHAGRERSQCMSTNIINLPSLQLWRVANGSSNEIGTNSFLEYSTNGLPYTNNVIYTNVIPYYTNIMVDLDTNGLGPYTVIHPDINGTVITSTIVPILAYDPVYYLNYFEQFIARYGSLLALDAEAPFYYVEWEYWTYPYDWDTWFEEHPSATAFPELTYQGMGALMPDVGLTNVPPALFDANLGLTNSPSVLRLVNPGSSNTTYILFGSLAYTGGSNWVWNDVSTAPPGRWGPVGVKPYAVWLGTNAPPEAGCTITLHGAVRDVTSELQTNSEAQSETIDIAAVSNELAAYWYDVTSVDCTQTNLPIGSSIAVLWTQIPDEYGSVINRMHSDVIDLPYRIIRKLNWNVSVGGGWTAAGEDNSYAWSSGYDCGVTSALPHFEGQRGTFWQTYVPTRENAITECEGSTPTVTSGDGAPGQVTSLVVSRGGYDDDSWYWNAAVGGFTNSVDDPSKETWTATASATKAKFVASSIEPPTGVTYDMTFWASVDTNLLTEFSDQGSPLHGVMLTATDAGGGTSDWIGVNSLPTTWASGTNGGTCGYVANSSRQVLRKFTFVYEGDF